MQKNNLLFQNGKNITILFALAVFIFSGCSKKIDNPADAPSSADNSSTTAKYVITPQGPMLASLGHYIAPGYHLSLQNGHVLKIHTATGKMIEDFGEVRKDKNPLFNLPVHTSSSSGNIATGTPSNTVTPPQLVSWIAYTQWLNTSGQTLNYFSTNWTVPSVPTTNNGQLIYIFNGLQNAISGADIVQPVLQWGNNGTFGDNNWRIANWYVWNGGYAYSGPEIVGSGAALQGVISFTGTQADGSFNYTSSFVGHPSSALNVTEGNLYNGGGGAIPKVPQQFAAFETLESYHGNSGDVLYSTDYPPDPYVSMSNITLSAGGNPAALVWTPETTQYTTFGESAGVLSDNAAGAGDVNIFFRYYAPKINGATNPISLYTAVPSASGTITGYPGQAVTVQVNAYDKDPMATCTIHWSTNASVRWLTGSGSLTTTASNGSGSYNQATFFMPASGSITWSATYTQSGGSTLPYDGANVKVF